MELSNVKKFFRYEIKYNPKLALCYIIIIRKTSDERKRERCKELLYNMLKTLVLNNIANFYNMLSKIAPQKIYLFSPEDVFSECYIVLEKCLENFGMKKGRWGEVIKENGKKVYDIKIMRKFNFYHYFNKSLTRSLLTYLNKSTKTKLQVESVEDFNDCSMTTSLPAANFVKYELRLQGFHRLDIELIYSRLTGEKMVDFLKRFRGWNTDEYYRRLKTIKQKLHEKPIELDFEFGL